MQSLYLLKKWMIEINEKVKAITLAFFLRGCNQSQIHPQL